MSSPSRFLQRLAARFRSESEAAKPGDTVEAQASTYDASRPNFLSRSRQAKFQIGQVVRHRVFPFRGVIFDVDPEFNNSEEWYESIPEEVRPHKDQPYYHLFAENERTHYIAYVSEQNLLPDDNEAPVSHPDIPEMFDRAGDGYVLKGAMSN